MTDVGNLDWFVGELYIVDPDIRPDTKRDKFEPSSHLDAVITALRKEYSSIALRARGWSEQVNAESKAKAAQEIVAEVRQMLTDGGLTNQQKLMNVRSVWGNLERLESDLSTVRAKANENGTSVERTQIIRRYLQRPSVK